MTQPEPGLRAQVDAAIEGLPLRLARIETTYAGASVDAVPTLSIDDLAALSPADFFARLYRHRFGDAAPDELMAAFAELLNTPAASESELLS